MSKYLAVLVVMLSSLHAHADVIGVARNDAGAVYLHDEPRACVGGAWYAQWRGNDGGVVDGCWQIIPKERVQAVFLDADVALISFDAIKQPQGL